MYTSERNILILLSLLKKHGVKKVIASPGTTNMTFVASMQHDSWFEVYSAVDERSAAYMAVGMATETQEPVVITCTEATASRNYMSALTEAYYRKLPIIAITGTHGSGIVGQYMPQVIDRSVLPKDVALMSVELPLIKSKQDEWLCVVKTNDVLLETKKNGGGPVHINLVTSFNRDYPENKLPEVKVIRRYSYCDTLPKIEHDKKKIAIFVGSHKHWSEELTNADDSFCCKYNAAVFVDHTSGYKGKYRLLFSLLSSQDKINRENFTVDLRIVLGQVSGGEVQVPAKEEWRVSEDGIIRDRAKLLTKVFQMDELYFFKQYSAMGESGDNEENNVSFYLHCQQLEDDILTRIPEIPFSNVWIAKETASKLPENSGLYLGILNSLRSWNFFDIPNSVTAFSNVGGFGIDGGMSSLIGAAIVRPDKLFFCVLGDLSFFYDMNVLGNRHIGSNVRILLINNGCGVEFKNYSHPAYGLGNEGNEFIAAAGHFGNKSKTLVKHYAEDLGFKYLFASSKEEYMAVMNEFLSPEIGEQSIILEAFTQQEDESNALKTIRSIYNDPVPVDKKALLRKMVGDKAIQKIKGIING